VKGAAATAPPTSERTPTCSRWSADGGPSAARPGSRPGGCRGSAPCRSPRATTYPSGRRGAPRRLPITQPSRRGPGAAPCRRPPAPGRRTPAPDPGRPAPRRPRDPHAGQGGGAVRLGPWSALPCRKPRETALRMTSRRTSQARPRKRARARRAGPGRAERAPPRRRLATPGSGASPRGCRPPPGAGALAAAARDAATDGGVGVAHAGQGRTGELVAGGGAPPRAGPTRRGITGARPRPRAARTPRLPPHAAGSRRATRRGSLTNPGAVRTRPARPRRA
jgi:hypothetical protein